MLGRWATTGVADVFQGRQSLTKKNEEVLDDLRRRGSHHALEHVVPEELRGWLLDISWDLEQLWASDLPNREIELSWLRWHFGLPWWRASDRRWFQVRPAQVLADPDRYPEHRDRLCRASLEWPLHVLRRHGRWLIVDGVHRAARAEQQGLRTVRTADSCRRTTCLRSSRSRSKGSASGTTGPTTSRPPQHFESPGHRDRGEGFHAAPARFHRQQLPDLRSRPPQS